VVRSLVSIQSNDNRGGVNGALPRSQSNPSNNKRQRRGVNGALLRSQSKRQRRGVDGALLRSQSNPIRNPNNNKRQARGSSGALPRRVNPSMKTIKAKNMTNKNNTSKQNTPLSNPMLFRTARRTARHDYSQFVALLSFVITNQVGSMREVGGRNPCVVLRAPSFPSNQIMQFLLTASNL
jgi:hypothetical protein